jgi:hypothetical protein
MVLIRESASEGWNSATLPTPDTEDCCSGDRAVPSMRE